MFPQTLRPTPHTPDDSGIIFFGKGSGMVDPPSLCTGQVPDRNGKTILMVSLSETEQCCVQKPFEMQHNCIGNDHEDEPNGDIKIYELL